MSPHSDDVPLSPTGWADVQMAKATIRAAYDAGNTATGFVIDDLASLRRAHEPSPRLSVSLAKRTVTLDGTTYDVASVQALRWVSVLLARPGAWVSCRDLKAHDTKLANVKTHRLKAKLPKALQVLIDSETGKGSRINLA